MDWLNKIRGYNLFIAREVVNVFPQYIADQRRVSRFSWSLYLAQTLDQVSCWRSKMCFQKFIIYILKYTHRKAPSKVFIRTWVLANQNREQGFFCTCEKKWYVQSNPTEVCEFGAQISAFFGACRLQRALYDSQKFNAKVRSVRLKKNEFLP